MKYISLDLETTCIEDKSPKNILMISMVVEDTNNLMPLDQLPHFTCFVNHPKIEGEAYALAMNNWILDIISGRKPNTTKHPVYNETEWISKANEFLSAHFPSGEGKITIAGKNVGMFDFGFLPISLQKRISYKIIDPAVLFTDFLNDKKLPGLSECKKRAGLEELVTHDAFDDALDIIRLMRQKYGKN